MIRVVICHEWAIFREGLRTQLERDDQISVILSTDSPISAMVEARTGKVDVVLTGDTLRGMSGLELVHRLQGEHTENTEHTVAQVVQLSTADPDQIDEALRARPSAILMQDASGDDVCYTVRAAHAGRRVVAGEVTDRLLSWFSTADDAIGADERTRVHTDALTNREIEILTLVAEGRSTEEIASTLFIGLTTVRTHLYRLKGKLSVRDRAGMVRFAFLSGLVAA